MSEDKPVDVTLDDSKCSDMKANYSLECFPVSSIEGAQHIIDNPPTWVEQVPELAPRSSSVVQNVLSDCHSKENDYFPNVRLERKLVPKTLVCHDYKGGYQEDKYFIAVRKGGCYTFYNWAHIDTFVYFSHHLITIPPYCWIKAAHQNGVKILGTFITEFDTGRVICEEILKDYQSVHKMAEQLTEISKLFKFDGWLLNIENSLSDTSMLKEFVGYLTKCIHNSNPNGQVIWYDSITEKGLLKWQNKLNEQNRCFFDLCDGIYLNYNWTEDDLKTSIELARHRYIDIYAGIDIFGRNTFYRQGFDSYKVMKVVVSFKYRSVCQKNKGQAAKLIRRYNMSMAIFAPGWTQESLDRHVYGDDTFLEKFLDRDFALWNALWPFLYTHPITRTFFTTFYCGTDRDFFDLFNQEQQLSKIKHPKTIDLPVSNLEESIPTLTNKCKCLQYNIINKYTTCLITKKHLPNDESFIHHLFTCDIELSGSMIIFYHSKQDLGPEAKLNFTLSTCNKNGSYKKIILYGKKRDTLRQDMSVLEVNPSDDMNLIQNINTQYYYSWLSDGTWLLSVYTFHVDPCTLLEIGASLEDGDSVYLCSFGFYDHE